MCYVNLLLRQASPNRYGQGAQHVEVERDLLVTASSYHNQQQTAQTEQHMLFLLERGSMAESASTLR